MKYGDFFIQLSDYNYVFINEVGYSSCVQRNRESKEKKRLIAKLPLSKKPNYSCCMAITDSDVLYFNKRRLFERTK
mgnify:CR=1 FL=1